MAQSIEKITSRIKRLERKKMAHDFEIPPGDTVHLLEGTKAEREQQQAAIMKKLELRYPDIDMDQYPLRDIRPAIVEKVQERMESGYNPARPLTVVKDNGNWLVADGNHRFEGLINLDIKEVPCVIREGNPYSIAMECNHDEDTYAPEDLFDKLDTIKALKDAGKNNSEIPAIIGGTENQIERLSAITSNVSATVLRIAKQHESSRGGTVQPNGGFNFTEGWFRNSGIYKVVCSFRRSKGWQTSRSSRYFDIGYCDVRTF